MGCDDIFKRKRKENKARKFETRNVKPNSFLIVSEGTKTEVLYFEGLKKYIQSRYGGNIDVIPLIDVDGEGKCTVSLVEETAKIVNRAHIIYEHVWVVFDKDDFGDFDKAIALAEEKGFKAAWSNQCFEYWLYLHYYYSEAALLRGEWFSKMDKIFTDRGFGNYQKNLENIFELVTQDGGLKTAVSRAKKILNKYSAKELPHLCDPCTTVHKLILELKPFIKDLI